MCLVLCWIHANQLMCSHILLWPICKYRLCVDTTSFYIGDLVSEGAPGIHPQQTLRDDYIVLSLNSIAFIIALFLPCPNLFTIFSVLFVKLFPRYLSSLLPLRMRWPWLTVQLSSWQLSHSPPWLRSSFGSHTCPFFSCIMSPTLYIPFSNNFLTVYNRLIC